HKAVILAFLAHGKWVKYSEMLVEGIRNVSQEDIQQAAELGYSIKLLAVIEREFEANQSFVRVHPALISRQNVLANLGGPFNGISVGGDVVGTTVYIGRGAGQDATASAVISDIADAALLLQGTHRPLLPEEAEGLHEGEGVCGILPLSEVGCSYYLRLKVRDVPGVLAQVATVMAKNHVSIA